MGHQLTWVTGNRHSHSASRLNSCRDGGKVRSLTCLPGHRNLLLSDRRNHPDQNVLVCDLVQRRGTFHGWKCWCRDNFQTPWGSFRYGTRAFASMRIRIRFGKIEHSRIPSYGVSRWYKFLYGNPEWQCLSWTSLESQNLDRFRREWRDLATLVYQRPIFSEQDFWIWKYLYVTNIF